MSWPRIWVRVRSAMVVVVVVGVREGRSVVVIMKFDGGGRVVVGECGGSEGWMMDEVVGDGSAGQPRVARLNGGDERR